MQEFRDDVELNEWQIREIRDAVAEANAGDFATDEAVSTVLNKWSADPG